MRPEWGKQHLCQLFLQNRVVRAFPRCEELLCAVPSLMETHLPREGLGVPADVSIITSKLLGVSVTMLLQSWALNPRTFWVGRDPQGSSSPSRAHQAHPGINPRALGLSAPALVILGQSQGSRWQRWQQGSLHISPSPHSPGWVLGKIPSLKEGLNTEQGQKWVDVALHNMV